MKDEGDKTLKKNTNCRTLDGYNKLDVENEANDSDTAV